MSSRRKLISMPSQPDTDTHTELVLLRHSIKAIRDRVCEDLDAMDDRIMRLLPAETDNRNLRYRQFTKKDWATFLDRGKIKKRP